MPIFKHKTKAHPFSSLFQRLSPLEFVLVFRDERIQTLGFMLSYAPCKNYSRKVIKLIRDKTGREKLVLALQSIRKTKRPVDTEFIAALEKAALDKLDM